MQVPPVIWARSRKWAPPPTSTQCTSLSLIINNSLKEKQKCIGYLLKARQAGRRVLLILAPSKEQLILKATTPPLHILPAFKGTVAWDFLVWGFFGNQVPPGPWFQPLNSFPVFGKCSELLANSVLRFASKTWKVINNTESNYLPHIETRRVINFRVSLLGK